MPPLTTRQGLPAEALRERIGRRELLIWGRGELAEDVAVSLQKMGLSPKGFLHDRPQPGARCRGRPVFPAAEALSGGPAPFIVIAAAAYRREAEAKCAAAGLRRESDFLTHLAIPRPHAIVEIVSPSPAGERMDPDDFARVVAKLDADLPLLSHIELSAEGDPLLHPELPDIIRRAERVAPCSVVTRLTGEAPLGPVLAAGPSRFEVTLEGGEAATRPAFAARLEQLREALAQAPETTCRLRLYPSREDPPDLARRWRERLDGSGIGLALHTPYVMPYDYLLAYAESGVLSAEVLRQAERLPWDLERALAQSAADAELPCLSQRIFPIIRPNRPVVLCHLYRGPVLADDYLAIGWEELLQRRHRAEQCRRCQRHGLHRLDLDVLRRRHPAVPLSEREHDHR
ncbi:hypothetical protein [Endothiovibrio diazotrophicus]